MPPRSAGCRVCVRRRVKCDLTRPVCIRCQKRGLECDGYPIHIIDQSESTAAKVQQQDSAILAPTKKPSIGVRATQNRRRRSRIYEFLELAIPLSAYKDDEYFFFFLDKYFCYGHWNDDLQGNRIWMLDVLQGPSKNPVSNLALRCLVTGYFGHVHRDANLKACAGRLYIETLRSLKRSLEDETRADSFDTLSATHSLLVYECCAFTTETGWIRHSQGLQHLVQRKGPEYFRQQPARSFLVFARYSLHIEALRAGQRSFMEAKEWRDILRPVNKITALGIELTDIANILPGIIEDSKKLSVQGGIPGNGQADTAREIRGTLLGFMEGLRSWWLGFNSDPDLMPVLVKEIPEELTVRPLGDESFLNFANLEVAACFCRYHAYMIICYRTLLFLEFLIPTPQDDNAAAANQSNEEIARHTVKHARAICDGLPFYCLPQYRYVGGLFIGLPAHLAWLALPQDSEESVWLSKSLDQIADQSGFELARHMCAEIEEVGSSK